MRKLLYLCVFSALALSISSCGDKKPQSQTSTANDILKQNPRYDTAMVRSHDDSAMIVKMANDYLELLKQNKVDEALGLLYQLDDSSHVIPLSDSRKNVLKTNFSKYPVLSYAIDEYHLYSDFDTDVRYTFDFMVKPEGAPENLPTSMKGALSPFRVSGTWYLSVSEVLNDPELKDMENKKYSDNNLKANEEN